MNHFTGKTAVVTGAASGIGLALSKRCLAEGMQVMMADIDASALAASYGQIIAPPGRLAMHVTDVADEEQVKGLLTESVRRFDQIHVLFNNAGVTLGGLAWENSAKDWEWAIGVNLLGTAHALRCFIPHMLAHGEPGYVVNTASIGGLTTGAGQGAYRASKHALVSLSESLYCDLRTVRSRIGVSVLCPAFVRTNILHSEARRQAAYQNQAPQQDNPQRAHFRQIMQTALDAAPMPEQVADEVFDAICANRFYIFPNAETDELIEDRAQALTRRYNPLMPLLP